MRDIVEFVTSTLAPVGVPVMFQAYPTGATPPDQYITFLEYHDEAELEAGDEEITTQRLIQVNVWSKGNYHPLVQNVRKILKQAEFQRLPGFDAPYQDGDSHFNKVLRFAFFDEY